MRQCSRFLLIVAFAVAGARASAQTSAPTQIPQNVNQPPRSPPVSMIPADTTLNRHLGFFIRPDIGLGYATSTASSGYNNASVSGLAGFAGVSIGGAVTENVILAGHIFGVGVSNPTVSMNGSSTSTSDASASVAGFGPEVDYYFMPANVYIGVTLALTKQSLKVNGVQSDTDTGFGTVLALGKEWWVSDHWGLGIAGKFTFSANKDTGTNPPTWYGYGFAGMFSATYN